MSDWTPPTEEYYHLMKIRGTPGCWIVQDQDETELQCSDLEGIPTECLPPSLSADIT